MVVVTILFLMTPLLGESSLKKMFPLYDAAVTFDGISLSETGAAAKGEPEIERVVKEREKEKHWKEEFSQNMPSRNKIDVVLAPYLARPVVPHTIMENEKASGTWLGKRDFLTAHGINFSLTYTSDIAGNPVGGIHPGGCTYADVFVLASFLETEKLFGWHGGYFTVSAMELNGSNLSQKNIGNIFPVQETYAVETIHFNEFSYEQKLLEDHASIKCGRIVAGNEFSISPLAFLYMNSGINGNPEALWLNGRMSTYYNAVWGSRLKLELPHATVARLGAYQVTPSSRNGLNWNFYPENGVMLLAQYGWSPEFFQPSPQENPLILSRGKEPSYNPALSSTNHATSQGFMGHYWMGGYYSTAEYAQFNSSTSAASAFGLYWHADQVVYKTHAGSNEGLILWSDYVLCPQENISTLPFQVNGGAIYTGLLPGRENDFTTLGIIYGDFSHNYASAQQQNGNGSPTYELVFESGYRINLTKYSYVQPDMQWITHPSGLGSIPNAFVLGAEIGVVS